MTGDEVPVANCPLVGPVPHSGLSEIYQQATLENVSQADCEKACRESHEYVCKSFQMNGEKCFLMATNRDEVALEKMDGVLYFELSCNGRLVLISDAWP